MPATGILVPPGLVIGIAEFARQTEDLGFDTLWLAEDCFLNGGFSQAATVLAATTRITVGLGILPAAARHPAFAAMEVATLARLHPGRLVVGLGHGMPNWMRQLDLWPASPLTLLEETFVAMRALLNGECVTMDGRYVRLHDVRLGNPPDVQPLLMAGVRGPRSLRLAARLSDGIVLAEPVGPEYLAWVRREVGADFAGSIVAYNVAAVDDDAAVARDRARGGLSWIGEADWEPHIAPLPFAAAFADARRNAASREEFAAEMPDSWVDQLSVTGDPATARARLRVLHSAGVDDAVFIPAGPDPHHALRSLAAVLRV